MNFSELSKKLRQDAGLSQVELSQKTGLSKACISMIEIGRNEPTAKTLIAYADFFGCSIDYLLGREDDFGIVNAHPELTERQKTLLDLYDQLPDVRQKTILDTMADMVAARKMNKSTNKWA